MELFLQSPPPKLFGALRNNSVAPLLWSRENDMLDRAGGCKKDRRAASFIVAPPRVLNKLPPPSPPFANELQTSADVRQSSGQQTTSADIAAVKSTTKAYDIACRLQWMYMQRQ